MDTLTIFVRKLRKRLGLTQQQLADKIGNKRVNIAGWEGRYSIPGPELLKVMMLDKDLAKVIRRILFE